MRLKHYFKRFLLAASAAVVSRHSEDVSPKESLTRVAVLSKTKTAYFFSKPFSHSEQSEESISKPLLSNKDSSVTSFPQNDVNRAAFTLAEVLITLGVIGVVAAMTMPSLIANYQKNVLKNQFKKTYSMLSQAIVKTQADLGYNPECYFYETGPLVPHRCAEWNSNGICVRYETNDGGPIPSDINGKTSECAVFKNALLKNLAVVKSCRKVYADGCIPAYRGYEDILRESDDSLSDEDVNKKGYISFQKSNFYVKPGYVLSDGSIIIDVTSYMGIFTVDINGKKGPNKWGYDLYNFRLQGLSSKPVYLAPYPFNIIEKGGTSAVNMVKNMGD